MRQQTTLCPSQTAVCKYPNWQLPPLTLVVVKCFIFRHLKLKLLTEFPASAEEKHLYLCKIDIYNMEVLD